MAVRKSRVMENKMLVSITNMNRIGMRKDINVISGFDGDNMEKLMLTTVWYMRFGYGSQNPLANVYSTNLDADLAIINENAAKTTGL